MKKIIIQGDDYGYSESINKGIEKAYTYGVLTETTVLVNLLSPNRKFEYRDRLKNLENKSGLEKPKLGIGIHLNITTGKPLSPNWPFNQFSRPYKGKGLSKEWSVKSWIQYFSSFPPQLIEDEFKRQIELGLEIFEEIDHLDSHHFSVAYQPVKEIYIKLAKKYKLAARPAFPLSNKPAYGGNFIYKKSEIEILKKHKIKTADRYCIEFLSRNENPVQTLINKLSKIKDKQSAEFMFHPAAGKNAEEWRVKDLQLLTNKDAITYFKNRESKISFISYDLL